MSRGFVKEGDQEEAPIIPPRAPLPAGVDNYVTPLGMELLNRERTELETEISELPTLDENQRRRELAVLNGKLNLLLERIASARIVDPSLQPQNEIRFGAVVTFVMAGKTSTFQIVGVDEADFRKQKIAFTAPIATALTGAKAGETVSFKLGNETRELKVLGFKY